ncbi:hypothetical protein ASPZODRAFT_64588 [Penicilliopsis zonata CBS 506.65]|uniref:Methyltransferase small domain-containing protein n=1 Tax=Penicilliopsis zonata CBS 506.65 TaxID=1073090 RepID=A0A1L9SLN4_9EURO|nr:hypothetical protein ASPZODRAFT_64588 [Penicilliopsis zonata CBS 506.65]OJJ48001.1 hypothetical protein ASPZODRAFT_64588 [Penicilliopsis zonata CBS 506.65]
MLPTPDTSHVPFNTVYEPAEDSYLFLDTLSSPAESAWLATRFATTPAPLITEVGCGSGVVLGFATANAQSIFGRRDVLAIGTDVNLHACLATRETVQRAVQTQQKEEATSQQETTTSLYLDSLTADLCRPLRPGSVDVLLFNPPYVPTPDLPPIPSNDQTYGPSKPSFETESYLLSLTYAGGADGMETTNRLLELVPDVLADHGVAYVLLCAQNKPAQVRESILAWPGEWQAEIVGRSGMQAGWEKLVILRIWRST